MKTAVLVWACLAFGIVIGWVLRARLERADEEYGSKLFDEDRRSVEELIERSRSSG